MSKYSYHTINHPTLAPERREWMAAQAERAKIDLNFFPCITINDISSFPHEYNETWTRWRHGRAMKPTELACAFSHIQLWKNLLSSSDDYYVICEDDMEFAPDLDQIVRECLSLKRGRIIKLSVTHPRPHKGLVTFSTGHQLVRFRFAPLSAGAYIISRSGAEQLILYCYKIHAPIDEMMRLTIEHGITNYGIVPYPVLHAAGFDSLVGDRQSRYDHNNIWMKGYSRACRFADHVRKRVAISRD